MELRVPVAGGEVWAEDRPGSEPPVVLLHPGWGDSAIWDPVLERLRPGTRTVRFDERGYGRSPGPTVPFSPLADLRTVLDRLAVPPAVVVGHSGGGGTALALALEEPARVRSLVLLAPGVPDYPWPEDDPYVVRFGELIAADDRTGLAELGMRVWAPAGGGTAVEAQILGAVEAFFAQGDLVLPYPPVFERLGELTVPAVVVTAGRDHPAVNACARAVAARIPGCRQLDAPDSDHLLPLRCPELVAELIGAS